LLHKVVQEVEQKLKEPRLPTPKIYYYDDLNIKRGAITRLLAGQCRYVLAVVDPTGAEIKWDTIKAILELRQQDVIVDVMFNFMCAALRRQKKKACKETPSHTFDEFFGGNHWRQCCQKRQTFGECLHNTYIQNIKNAGYAVYTTSIWKNQLWHYHFDLILRGKDKPHPLGSKLQKTLQLGEPDRRDRPSKYHNQQTHHRVHNQQIQTPDRLHVNSYQ